jgi:hypothetical protein
MKLIRAANMMKHAVGSASHTALEFLTAELGLSKAVVEDVTADAASLSLINELKMHRDTPNGTFFDEVVATPKHKLWHDKHALAKDLKPALKLLGVTPKGGKAAVAKLLIDNLNKTPSSPGVTQVQLAVLSSWHLKPFTGSDSTKIGIENEDFIFKMLPSHVSKASCVNCPKITSVEVSFLREVGLVESKAHPTLTCSADHLCMLKVVWSNGDPDYYEPAVCEAKTRAKDSTAEAETAAMEAESLHEMFHVETPGDYAKHVRDPGHRVQNWHHVGCFGRRFSLFIVARKNAIIRVALIDVSEAKREKYMDAMTVLWTTHMTPFETVETMPDSMKTADLGFLVTFEKLQFAIGYRIGLRNLARKEGVLPPAAHILDILVSIWNKTKGGTDQHSRAMEDLHGKWENFLPPTCRLTVRVLKAVFFQAKNAFCLLGVATSLVRGETLTCRAHLKKLSRVIILRKFVSVCSNVFGDFLLSGSARANMANENDKTPDVSSARANPGMYSTPDSSSSKAPDRFSKGVKNYLKLKFNKEGPLKQRRLKKPERHQSCTTSDPQVPEGMQNKQVRCVVCCDKCNDATGLVKARSDFHVTVKKGHSPKPGIGRSGHKTSNICVTCGFTPLCTKPRTHGPNAKSCWGAFHTCDDLFNGLPSTMCDIQNPQAEYNVPAKHMSTLPTKKFKEGSKKCTGKRARSVGLVVNITRQSKRKSAAKSTNGKSAAI